MSRKPPILLPGKKAEQPAAPAPLGAKQPDESTTAVFVFDPGTGNLQHSIGRNINVSALLLMSMILQRAANAILDNAIQQNQQKTPGIQIARVMPPRDLRRKD